MKTFGKYELIISSICSAVCLGLFFADIFEHRTGFLAAIALLFGIFSIIGLLAGAAALISTWLGAVLNLALVTFIIYSSWDIIITAFLAGGSWKETVYPVWKIIPAVSFLAISVFLIPFFVIVGIKDILSKMKSAISRRTANERSG